jgi:thiol:disulfide interchange protein
MIAETSAADDAMTTSTHHGAESGARHIAASALLGDFERFRAGELIPAIPDWRVAAQRLATALGSVLELASESAGNAAVAARLAELATAAEPRAPAAVRAAVERWHALGRHYSLSTLETIEHIVTASKPGAVAPTEPDDARYLSASELENVLAAIEDAVRYRLDQAATWCVSCSEDAAPPCPHQAEDIDKADAYEALSARLRGVQQ